MTLFNFLFLIQAFVAAGLVLLVLMQRSEGGGLGIGGGGSPGGVMSARGAADFLTRATKWFAVAFVVLAVILASLAVDASGGGELDDTLDRSISASDEIAPGTAAPVAGEDADAVDADDPLADVAE
ncbi:preprotein translocase subunit SecG [Erythrobacter alti]|uniref:preprotein translocase subunit SecG n=1 Tax=Erythrobacter alti TaxID=1896145 RepID=UPI0030F40519